MSFLDSLSTFMPKDSVITLVVLADGVEIGAISFRSDTVAFNGTPKANDASDATKPASMPIIKESNSPESKPKSTIPEKKEIPVTKDKVEKAPKAEAKNVVPEKPLTREMIMAQSAEPEKSEFVHPGKFTTPLKEKQKEEPDNSVDLIDDDSIDENSAEATIKGSEDRQISFGEDW